MQEAEEVDGEVEEHRRPDISAEDPQVTKHETDRERIDRPEDELAAQRKVAQGKEEGSRRQAETRLHRPAKEQLLAQCARRRQQRRIRYAYSPHCASEAAEERSCRGKQPVCIEIEENVQYERRGEQRCFRGEMRPVRVERERG